MHWIFAIMYVVFAILFAYTCGRIREIREDVNGDMGAVMGAFLWPVAGMFSLLLYAWKLGIRDSARQRR